MDDDLLSQFRLPEFSELLHQAEGRTETGCFRVYCGAVLQGNAGPIGLNLAVDNRQVRYWLPSDHPNFNSAHAEIKRASKADEHLGMVLDPVSHIVLDVAVKTDGACED